MHRGVVLGEFVDEEDFNHVADFSAEGWALDALSCGLGGKGCKRRVRVASVECFLPFCSEGAW